MDEPRGISIVTEVPALKEAATSWHALPVEVVLAALGVSAEDGLTSDEAAVRTTGLERASGDSPRRPSRWRALLRGSAGLGQLLLAAAAVASFVIPGQSATGIVLVAVVLLNGALGIRRELAAPASGVAPGLPQAPAARAHRDGRVVEIPAGRVVPGDIVDIAAGDFVPADGRILEADSLEIDESAITGERAPARKGTEAVAADTPLAERSSLAWTGTRVVAGSGTLVVVAAGTGTGLDPARAGAGAPLGEPPVSVQLGRLSTWLLAAAGGALLIAVALGLARGQDATSLALAVLAFAAAVLPSGQPVTVAVVGRLAARAGTPVAPGRAPDDGLAHATHFLVATRLAFIATLLGASILGFLGGVPLLPLQALWLNLTVVVLQAIGVGGAGASPRGASSRPPRRQPVAPPPMLAWLAVSGLSMAVGTLGLAVYAANTWDSATARTMGLATLALFLVWHSLETADPRRPVLSRRPRLNARLLGLGALSLGLLVVAVSSGPLEELLQTRALTVDQWLQCLAVSLSIGVVMEAKKRLGISIRGEAEPTAVPTASPAAEATG